MNSRLGALVALIAIIAAALWFAWCGVPATGREVVPIERKAPTTRRAVAIETIQRLHFSDGTDSGDQYSFAANIDARP